MYRFTGFVRSEDGTVETLSVAISAPMDSGKGDSVCRLSFPFLRAEPFLIYGVDHDQARQLSRRFVELGLEYRHLKLVNADGKPVALPPVPNADELAPDDPA